MVVGGVNRHPGRRGSRSILKSGQDLRGNAGRLNLSILTFLFCKIVSSYRGKL